MRAHSVPEYCVPPSVVSPFERRSDAYNDRCCFEFPFHARCCMENDDCIRVTLVKLTAADAKDSNMCCSSGSFEKEPASLLHPIQQREIGHRCHPKTTAGHSSFVLSRRWRLVWILPRVHRTSSCEHELGLITHIRHQRSYSSDRKSTYTRQCRGRRREVTPERDFERAPERRTLALHCGTRSGCRRPWATL